MEPLDTPPPKPLQGEIWYAKLATDPPEYLGRPVVVVSLNARNQEDRADTVLVVPLSTTIKDPLQKTNLRLAPGETNLNEWSELQASGITTIRKKLLHPPRTKLRQISRSKIQLLVPMVGMAIGFLPEELADPK
jgi:mRNA-degrading endonuclease toxin of MazEF toxin-antitoxin module